MDRLMDALGAMNSPKDADGGLANSTDAGAVVAAPQTVLLDLFFPGFSVFSAAVQRYLHIDLNLYIPLVLLAGGMIWAWQYFSEYVWNQVEKYMMSVVDIRTDDEIYNMLMSWVAAQRFAQGARRFVVNTNLSSRSWWAYRWDDEEGEDDDTVPDGEYDYSGSRRKKKALAYTPTFGSHWFWYKNRILIFNRSENKTSSGFMTVSEKEEISISCFGRNPWVLKELLHEARTAYVSRDEAKTLIYRGSTRTTGGEPTWQRCMSRTSRPFSTVILNDKIKKDLIDDVTDYLDPATRRWYANRGIPYRRGYLLHGPPGTGKSSLSLALAGFFKMRIYIVSLSSPVANEENLATLFSELPRRCVVLLEDIDAAGLTSTREDGGGNATTPADTDMVPGQLTPGNTDGAKGGAAQPAGRLSLSGLLNILDGVASQEGRVLIMTTNHIEKLDKALIRPGRVDMTVEFGKADEDMTAAIFRAIFAPLEGDDAPMGKRIGEKYADLAQALEAERVRKAEAARKKEAAVARVGKLAEEFSEKIPAHEFSPAEIQGLLLKHKRSPESAVSAAEQWVADSRKERKERELKEAEDKRKKTEEEKKKKEEEAKKKKEEEEKKRKEEEEKQKKEEKERKSSRKSKRKSKKSSSRRKNKKDSDSSDSSSSSESESGSESDAEGSASKVERKKRSKAGEKKETAAAKPEAETTVVVVEPPATFKTESSNRTVVADADADANDKLRTDAGPEDGKQQGADSGYGTP